MSTKFQEEIDLAHELISEFGNPVQILVSQQLPEDGENPGWWGDDRPPIGHAAQAVVFPWEGDAATTHPNSQRAFIAGKGLNIQITGDMFLVTADGWVWAVKGDPTALAPDMGDPIFWECEVTRWPQRL